MGECPSHHPVEVITGNLPYKRKQLKSEQNLHYQLNVQASSLSRRMYKEHGVGLQELQVLKSIYLLYIGKELAVSKISPEQEQLLGEIGVDLSMC